MKKFFMPFEALLHFENRGVKRASSMFPVSLCWGCVFAYRSTDLVFTVANVNQCCAHCPLLICIFIFIYFVYM